MWEFIFYSLDLPKCNLHSWNKLMTWHILCFVINKTIPRKLCLFYAKPLERSPYKMTMVTLSRNEQFNKSTHIFKTTCARIKIVLLDSHRYSTHAGGYSISLTIVIYALRSIGLHWKTIVIQYCVNVLYWHNYVSLNQIKSNFI